MISTIQKQQPKLSEITFDNNKTTPPPPYAKRQLADVDRCPPKPTWQNGRHGGGPDTTPAVADQYPAVDHRDEVTLQVQPEQDHDQERQPEHQQTVPKTCLTDNGFVQTVF